MSRGMLVESEAGKNRIAKTVERREEKRRKKETRGIEAEKKSLFYSLRIF